MSAICRVMVVGVSSPKLSLLTIDKSIKLMLAPESQSAFPISKFPIVQGIVKLLGSYIFTSKDLRITALQVAVRLTTPSSSIFLSLLNISCIRVPVQTRTSGYSVYGAYIYMDES